MKPLFLNSDDDVRYIAQVVDENKFDKKHFNPKEGFAYYQFNGATSALNSSMDIRRGTVFGVKSFKMYAAVHVPQYKKIFKLPLKVANKILQKARPYSSQYYEEV